jgi:hypothetical protein
MPRKIRELIRDLRDAGFVLLKDRGDGDHAVYRFNSRPEITVVLDGRPGDDAQHYQEKQIRKAIRKARVAQLR